MEQVAHRHVLAERNPAHLLVTTHHLTVGCHHDLGVEEGRQVDGVLGDADHERNSEASGLGGDLFEFGAVGEADDVDVDDVLRPQHQVHRAGLDGSGCLEVAVQHFAGRGVDGVGPLGAAALDGGDADRLAGGLDRPGADRGEQPDGDRRCEGGYPVPFAPRRGPALASQGGHHR